MALTNDTIWTGKSCLLRVCVHIRVHYISVHDTITQKAFFIYKASFEKTLLFLLFYSCRLIYPHEMLAQLHRNEKWPRLTGQNWTPRGGKKAPAPASSSILCSLRTLKAKELFIVQSALNKILVKGVFAGHWNAAVLQHKRFIKSNASTQLLKSFSDTMLIKNISCRPSSCRRSPNHEEALLRQETPCSSMRRWQVLPCPAPCPVSTQICVFPGKSRVWMHSFAMA